MNLKDEIEDMSYTYKGSFEDWLEGAKWAEAKMMERTCEWIYEQLNNGKIECGDIISLIDNFKKTMED